MARSWARVASRCFARGVSADACVVLLALVAAVVAVVVAAVAAPVVVAASASAVVVAVTSLAHLMMEWSSLGQRFA